MDEVVDFIITLIGAVIGTVVAVLFISFLFAYPAMLLFGVVHSFLPVIPAFGYAQTFAIMLLLRLILPGPAVVKS